MAPLQTAVTERLLRAHRRQVAATCEAGEGLYEECLCHLSVGHKHLPLLAAVMASFFVGAFPSDVARLLALHAQVHSPEDATFTGRYC